QFHAEYEPPAFALVHAYRLQAVVRRDPIEEDALAIGDDDPRNAVFRPDRDVHGPHDERELRNLLQRNRRLTARVRPRVEIPEQESGEERSLRVRGLATARAAC